MTDAVVALPSSSLLPFVLFLVLLGTLVGLGPVALGAIARMVEHVGRRVVEAFTEAPRW